MFLAANPTYYPRRGECKATKAKTDSCFSLFLLLCEPACFLHYMSVIPFDPVPNPLPPHLPLTHRTEKTHLSEYSHDIKTEIKPFILVKFRSVGLNMVTSKYFLIM